MNFVQSISEERKNHINFVHVLLLKKKTFVTVTDAKGATKAISLIKEADRRINEPRGARFHAPEVGEGRSSSSFSNVNCYASRVEADRRFGQSNLEGVSRQVYVRRLVEAKERKKTGAVAGEALESRLSRHAAEATAEHVGRSARKMGLKSVVMKVKGSTFFSKKKKVILSWREGFRGSGVGDQSTILYIHDVTQLSHNGCRLPKKRRVQIAFWNL
nr:ribosomal protein S11 [Gastrodia peichatieniana]WNI02125.1 ribosomal protein S11 [Gastrodia menghaiensis]WOC30388.1 ribosomal protein S11 [Gastrodia longistyla]WOC30402.1 ribosomal protein S11 [Gastrodia longistyla]